MVKSIKPNDVKVDKNYIYVTLAFCSFTIVINDKTYQFIPNMSNRIKVDRTTKKVKNTEAIFSFHNDTETIYIGLSELIRLPEFLYQLDWIIDPFYRGREGSSPRSEPENEQEDTLTQLIIEELEQLNIKYLIDQALDERDEDTFYKLIYEL